MSVSTLKNLQSILQNPGSAYRSAPFWGWNDRLEQEELSRQLADMKDKGMGGAFIHSREGLETPYLSDEWMADTRRCAEDAAKLGMELWIYDEDKWPSGAAGGMVSAMDPDAFTAKALTLEVIPTGCTPTESETVIGIYPAGIDGNHAELRSDGAYRIVLRRETSQTSEWYNGFAPPDNLNPEAVKAFLQITHEAYRKTLGEDFGGVKGFFTDEPNCCDFFSIFTPGRPWLPWTDGFPAYFREKRGYDPLPHLPLLFFHGDGCERIRHDYWRTIAELFSESYMKQVYDYCEAHQLEVTGHILYENDLGYNTRVCGAAMPQYRYLHRPGIDLLGEQAREYLTVRQCTSAANQYGRENTICEAYGCTGWEFDFEGQKWLGDWMFVNGITRRCQHLTQYSITGCRKRDYPPVFHYQNTWWKHNRQMEDYFARLTACVQTGCVERDILVIHPISGIWTACGADPDEDLNRVEMNMGWTDRHIMALNELGNGYNRLAEALCRSHLDFDFGDEIIMAENAAVEGASLRVGLRHYSTVVVPETASLFASTADLLAQLAAAGGNVIWMGVPKMIEGVPSDRPAQLAARGTNVTGTEALLRELDKTRRLSALSVRGGEDTEILTMLRKTEDGYLLLAVNHDRNNPHYVTFTLPQAGAVTAYDVWNHQTKAMVCQQGNNGIQFAEVLAPADSRVYFIETGKAPVLGVLLPPYEHPHRTEPVFAVLGPTAKVRRTAPNALTLDVCSWQLGNGDFSAPMEVWKAQRDIRERLGMRQVYYNGAPQRYTWLERDKVPGAPFALKFTFHVRDIPEGTCRLAVEKPRNLTLTCNGTECALTEEWFSDRAMRCYTLPPLRKGSNELILSGEYTNERELEDVFLIGDFAVDNDRTLCRETGKIFFGDWCRQGYCHYSGSLVYSFTLPPRPAGKRAVLHMGAYSAACALLRVNGQEAGLLFGKSHDRLDITDYLTEASNTLEIEVVGTPRNLYGPFHQAYTGCSRISWEDFRTEGSTHCDDYLLHPYGLMEQITIILQ